MWRDYLPVVVMSLVVFGYIALSRRYPHVFIRPRVPDTPTSRRLLVLTVLLTVAGALFSLLHGPSLITLLLVAAGAGCSVGRLVLARRS